MESKGKSGCFQAKRVSTRTTDKPLDQEESSKGQFAVGK